MDKGQWTRFKMDTILHKGRRTLSAEYQLRCEQGSTKCIDTRDKVVTQQEIKNDLYRTRERGISSMALSQV